MTETTADIEFIVKAARAFLYPLFADNPPEVQSAVLADLTATYLAGVAPPLRPEMRAIFIKLIDDLVPVNQRANCSATMAIPLCGPNKKGD